MAEVEVSFRAVIGDIDFTVLVRAHRPRINVQIGIALLEGDFEARLSSSSLWTLQRRPFLGRKQHRR